MRDSAVRARCTPPIPAVLLPAVLPAVVIACADRVPLAQVPVTGGTEQQHAEARRIIETFEDATGAERITLTEVTFAAIYNGALGTFDPVADRIRLDPTLQQPMLERVLRHELCHALDYGEGLVEEPDAVFDSLVRTLFRLGVIDTNGLGGPRHRRGEAFARYCDMGPLVAHALRSACPGEPGDVSDAAAYLERQVWRTWEPPPSYPGLTAPSLQPHASWTAPAPSPDGFEVRGLTDPSRIRVRYGALTVDLDIDAGQPLEGPPGRVFAPQEELPEGISDLCPLYGSLPAGAGWSLGPAAVLVRFDLYNESATARMLASLGGEWGLVEGCVEEEHADLFVTADHRLWLAWVEDHTVSWAPLLE